MAVTPGQLPLELAHRPALGAEDFLISQSNQAAAAIVDRWPDWPLSSLVVVAPPRAGKTHLGNVWRLKSGAARVEACKLAEPDLPLATAKGALLVENLQAGIGDEQVLFHLLNLARESKVSMLLTSRAAPGELVVTLPDLRSRLRELPVVAIEPARRGPAQGGAGQAFRGSATPRGASHRAPDRPQHGAVHGGGRDDRCRDRPGRACRPQQGDRARW